MDDIEAIFEMLDRGDDIYEIRNAIADLIVARLHTVRESLGYWEKLHFAQAISAFAWNVRPPHEPTTIWLRLCLHNVEKALVPAEQRNENYALKYADIDALTLDQLINFIGEARRGV